MKILEYWTRLKLSDKILLIIFIFSSLIILLVRTLFGAAMEELLILSYIVYSLALAITYVVGRHFSRRIVRLGLRVQEMAAGNVFRPIEGGGKDEIGQLVNALNALMSRLSSGVTLDVSKDIAINQAKSDFVALASHQLRTPLSIIKWYLDYVFIGDAGAINEEQKKYIGEAFIANERLIELVNALLDVSRIDLGTFSIEPEPADLIDIATNAAGEFLSEAEKKKIKFERVFDDLPKISVDPRLMRKTFTNLLSNAMKYTPAGGHVRFSIKKAGDMALIKIADNGCGIPKAEQPKIFSKLFRADNVRKIESVGTGLGLYIVKAVIEQSGGKIWFQSPSLGLLVEEETAGRQFDEARQGTTFYITIPLKGMKARAGTKKLT